MKLHDRIVPERRIRVAPIGFVKHSGSNTPLDLTLANGVRTANVRVGIVTWGPVESRENGYFVRVSNIAHGLADLGHLVTVYEFSGNIVEKSGMRGLGQTPVGTRMKGKLRASFVASMSFDPFAVFESQASLLRRLWKIRKDIVNNDVVLVEGALLLPAFLFLGGKDLRLLYDTHNLNTRLASRMKKTRPLVAVIRRILWGSLERLAIRLACATVFVSKDEKAWAELVIGLCKPGYVLPHLTNFDLTPKRPDDPRPSFCLRPGSSTQIVATFVGDMTSVQNRAAADFIINKLSPALSRTRPEVQLVLVGRIPRDLQSGAPANVSCIGYVREVMSLLDQSDLLMAPMPYTSGVSTKMQLYLQSGRPIVVTENCLDGLSITARPGVYVVSLEKFLVKLVEVVDNLQMGLGTRTDSENYSLSLQAEDRNQWMSSLSEIIRRETNQ